MRIRRHLLGAHLICMVIVCWAVSAQGATSIPAGTLVDTTWPLSGSPYRVEGDIRVAGLTIEPGVRVEFAGNYNFEVVGTLIAIGNKEQSIVFTPAADNTVGWRGIHFNHCNNASCMEYCTIDGAINTGIYVEQCLPSLKNCTISGCNNTFGTGWGGGLAVRLDMLSPSDELVINDCTITGNSAQYSGGGVVAVVGSATLRFDGCSISSNVSNYNYANYGDYTGGGIHYVGTTGKMVLDNCRVLDNASHSSCTGTYCRAGNYGGGIYANGNLELTNTIIRGNWSKAYGHDVGWYSATSYSYGGGIFQYAGTLTATNSIVSHNHSKATGDEPYSYGGGYVSGDQVGIASFHNSTVAYNEPDGIYRFSGTVNVVNSILYFNTAAQVSGTVNVTYSDVQNGYTGEGNINGNPAFRSDQDLTIVAGSLCIDAGHPDSQYNDQCFPPSLGTSRNDVGAHGGPGGCNWPAPQNVAYYSIVAKPISYLWQYSLELHAMTWEGEDRIVGSSWSISDPTAATLVGNTLTGLRNGRVLVSTTYAGRAYTRMVYFKASGQFESPPNENLGTADALTEYGFMEGELLEGDVDYFKIVTNEFKSIELAYFSRSLTADALVEALDEFGNPLVSETSTNGQSVRIHLGIRPGTYYVRLSIAGDVDDDETYDIVYGAVDPALGLVFEAEPNDTLADANNLVIDQSIEGRLASSADNDFYRVQMLAPVYVDLVFECLGTDAEKQFAISVYNSSEANLISSFTVAEGQAAAFPMGLNIAEYFIKVSGIGEDVETNRSYVLTLRPSSYPDIEIESNNTIFFANAIAKGQAKTGTIYSASDIDFYGFDALEVGAIHVNFTPSTTAGDYKISIVDKNGVEKYAKTSVDGDPRTLNYGIESPGHYYIKVEALESGDIDAAHPYQLVLTSDVNLQPIIGLVSISIDAPATLIAIGEEMQLAIKKHFSDTSSQLLEGVEIVSLQPQIATVNTNGIVRGLANGKAIIVATYEGFVAQLTVTVGTGETVSQHYGSLIIVAGSGANESDPLTQSAQYLADLVYSRFQTRLFQNSDIYYFNPVFWHDLDGDGYDNNVVDDSSPTVAEFGQAITGWAAQQSTDGPLYIYLVGHGVIDTFSFPNETMSALQLRGFIDTFQNATGRRVVVIIEACKSGSFTGDLVSAGQNRIVVTSSDDLDSYMQFDGRISFTQFFTNKLLGGASFYESWQAAKNKLKELELPFRLMNPQLVEGIAMASSQTWLGGNFVIANLLPGWLIGQVVDASTGFSIQNASLDIGGMITLKTLENGCYLGQMPVGTYDITVSAVGYFPSNLPNIKVSIGDSVVRNIRLNPLGIIGDINGGGVGLDDAIVGLQVISGVSGSAGVRADYATSGADVNGDSKVGMEEVIYILQKVSGLSR
jgi:hypothetical protein